MNLSDHPIPILDNFVIVATDGRRFVFSCRIGAKQWAEIRLATDAERKAIKSSVVAELSPE